VGLGVGCRPRANSHDVGHWVGLVPSFPELAGISAAATLAGMWVEVPTPARLPPPILSCRGLDEPASDHRPRPRHAGRVCPHLRRCLPRSAPGGGRRSARVRRRRRALASDRACRRIAGQGTAPAGAARARRGAVPGSESRYADRAATGSVICTSASIAIGRREIGSRHRMGGGASGGVGPRSAPRISHAANNLRSGSRSPRSTARSTSTQSIPREFASTRACGLIVCAASTPRHDTNAGSVWIRSR
jgi:hypothetical protein